MEKVQWKPGTLLAPVPAVLVSCGTMEKPTALTIAWTGIICSDPAKTYISVRPERNSYNIIKESGEFVINMMPSTLVRSLDYCGIKSGKNEALSPGEQHRFRAADRPGAHFHRV